MTVVEQSLVVPAKTADERDESSDAKHDRGGSTIDHERRHEDERGRDPKPGPRTRRFAVLAPSRMTTSFDPPPRQYASSATVSPDGGRGEAAPTRPKQFLRPTPGAARCCCAPKRQ
jgi:hypothetical protein